MAVPRPLPARVRRRVRGRDARGAPDRRVPRSDRRARQGRLARGVAVLAAPGRRGRAHAPRLAVPAVRPHRPAGGDRAPRRARRRPAAHRLSEGLHGRDAGLADRANARRLRGRDHEPRGARRDRARGCTGGLARRGARDRRPREPRRARRLRGDPRRVGAARAQAAHRARAAPGRGGHPALRPAGRHRVRPVQPRPVRPGHRGPQLGRDDRPRIRLPLAARLRCRGRERLRRADRGARAAGRDPRRGAALARRARGVASGAGGHGRGGAGGDDPRAGLARARGTEAREAAPRVPRRPRRARPRPARDPAGGAAGGRSGGDDGRRPLGYNPPPWIEQRLESRHGFSGTSGSPDPPPVRCADRRLRRRTHNPPPWD